MDIKLNFFIKKIILGFLRKITSLITKRRSSPYSIQSIFLSQVNISDFFVWNPHVERIDFIAENIRALFTGEKMTSPYFEELPVGQFYSPELHNIIFNPKTQWVKYFNFTATPIPLKILFIYAFFSLKKKIKLNLKSVLNMVKPIK